MINASELKSKSFFNFWYIINLKNQCNWLIDIELIYQLSLDVIVVIILLTCRILNLFNQVLWDETQSIYAGSSLLPFRAGGVAFLGFELVYGVLAFDHLVGDVLHRVERIGVTDRAHVNVVTEWLLTLLTCGAVLQFWSDYRLSCFQVVFLALLHFSGVDVFHVFVVAAASLEKRVVGGELAAV